MLLAYYIVVAVIAFWAISTHDQTRGRPFLSLFGAMLVPLLLPLIPIVGGAFWACTHMKQKRTLATDEGIQELIVACSRSKTESKFPSLRYARLSDFVTGQHCAAEWFPAYEGMRFWVEIESLVYFVRVKTLDASKEDASGVSIYAQLDA